MAAKFSRPALLNQAERRVFDCIERAIAVEAPEWRLMAQVNLGEILSSPDAEAYRAINTKRVDMLIVRGGDCLPLHAIEYQGGAHHQGNAAARDAIKKEALRKAGIGFVEVTRGDTPAEVRAMVRRLAQKRAA